MCLHSSKSRPWISPLQYPGYSWWSNWFGQTKLQGRMATANLFCTVLIHWAAELQGKQNSVPRFCYLERLHRLLSRISIECLVLLDLWTWMVWSEPSALLTCGREIDLLSPLVLMYVHVHVITVQHNVSDVLKLFINVAGNQTKTTQINLQEFPHCGYILRCLLTATVQPSYLT